MLMGEFSPKLDDKNRVILPAKFHADFESGIVLTRGQERCIYGFTDRDFRDMVERLRTAPISTREGRTNLRLLMSSASDQQPDKQHRISVPAALREYAGIERDIVVIGMVTRIEIWDAETWRRYVEENEDSFAEVAEEVIPGMI